MHSTDLEARMRQFEMALDHPVPPGFQIVARLDGRGFTRLTKEVCQFEAPFDPGFRDLMATACRHLMTCGFNVLLAYSESDEISLLLHEWLFQHGVNFAALPTWQKRGFAVYWVERERVGRNPLTGEATLTTRRELHTDEQLPWKEDYERALGRLLAGHCFLVEAPTHRGASDRTSTETARDRAADRACTRVEDDDD